MAQVETPWPTSFASDGSPSQRADAPVAMISVLASYSPSDVVTLKGRSGGRPM